MNTAWIERRDRLSKWRVPSKQGRATSYVVTEERVVGPLVAFRHLRQQLDPRTMKLLGDLQSAAFESRILMMRSGAEEQLLRSDELVVSLADALRVETETGELDRWFRNSFDSGTPGALSDRLDSLLAFVVAVRLSGRDDLIARYRAVCLSIEGAEFGSLRRLAQRVL
ncbi:MAG: hypothetical protein J0L92_11580 [Deltaproteobacteria bacterium]|nr:hypothetical protein [Deltaproteobacteria bacterium]